MSNSKIHLLLLLGLTGIFVWSLIGPHDLFTWFLEVLPAILGVAVLLLTYSKFKLTNLVYLLIGIHAAILMIGGHYTYAEMPLFNWIRDTFGLERNYYDRLGHFAQGFVPAMIVRELLVRTSPLKKGGWLPVTAVSFCMAISACYELFEFGIAVATGTAAEAFLGTQGDIWDTQWDMLMALCGSITALLVLSGLHNRQLQML